MSASTFRRSVALGLGLGLAVLAAAPFVSAQRGGGGGGGFGGALQKNRLDVIVEMFALDKEQTKTVKTAFDDALKAAAPMRDSLAKTYAAIGIAVQAGKDQATVDQAITAYAQEATAMTAFEMKTLAEVLKSLTAEQRAKTAAVDYTFYLMRGLFMDKKWNHDQATVSRGY